MSSRNINTVHWWHLSESYGNTRFGIHNVKMIGNDGRSEVPKPAKGTYQKLYFKGSQ